MRPGNLTLIVAGAFLGGIVTLVLARHWLNRMAVRAIMRFRPRLDRFKLTAKPYVIADLLHDPHIAEGVRAHAAEHAQPEDEVWEQVHRYLDEIVPFFNVLLYYRVGYTISKVLLEAFYKVSIEYAAPKQIAGLPKDAIVVYLMNHRSNADYVLVSFVLAGDVSISYAVGEWARAFPLEYIFKSFGSYFIRRRYREPLYHTVLERYVQLITRNGVTQGIFPEGGLTRDGRLRPAKIGLLDYMLGTARAPGFAERMYVVPVALNYDRVLEDRTLLHEARVTAGAPPLSRFAQFRGVLNYAISSFGRLSTRRWKRYGRAAVVIGEPVPVAPWLRSVADEGRTLFDRPRPERLARVQEFCDAMMGRIGQIIPVTAVPLVCAALQTFDAEYVPEDRLLARVQELRDALLAEGAVVIEPEREALETFERAYRMLKMRRVLLREGAGYVILPHGRELISYYANGIAHLCGAFEDRVRERDALPADTLIGA